jgi:hypothetical protein
VVLSVGIDFLFLLREVPRGRRSVNAANGGQSMLARALLTGCNIKRFGASNSACQWFEPALGLELPSPWQASVAPAS